MNKVFGTILTGLFVLSSFASFAQYDEKAKGVLDKVSAKYENMKGYSAQFSHQMHSPMNNGGRDETQTGEIKVAGAKFWLKLDQQDIIVDGKTMWTVVTDGDMCEVTIMDYEPEADQVTPQNIHHMYKTGYKFMYNTEEGTGANKLHIIDLIPKDKDQEIFKIRLSIRQSDYTITGWKMFEKSGNRYTYSIKNFKEVSNFPKGTFRFVKENYPKCEINDMRD